MADAMKLLPCPFCGEKPSDAIQNGYIENREEGGYFKFVWCENCDAKSAERKTEAEAAEAWNRRASPPAREEAPADPCAPHKAEGFSLDPCCPHCEAPAEGAGDWQATIDRIVPVIAPMDAIEASEFCCEHTLLLDRTRIRRELAAIRNRTSEPEAGEAGYVSAFYEIAAMLGIGARPDYPADVWQKEMKPALQRLIATAGVK